MRARRRAFNGRSNEINLGKMLIIQIFAQAIRDARGSNPRLSHMALTWLNEPEVRDLANWLGVNWGVEQITHRDLPGRVRCTYFEG